MKFLYALIFALVVNVSCKPRLALCGGVSPMLSILYPEKPVQADSLYYEGLPAFHKSNGQICATTLMRDTIYFEGKDTITIVNMPPLNK